MTKALAEARLERGERIDLLGDVLGLRLIYNSGAAFGLGTSITPVITVFMVVAVAVMVGALLRTWSRAWTIAVGVLLGGGLGNLVDRLFRPPGIGRGEVVDFLELPSWPIFNVADMSVVSGAVLIVALSLRNVPFGRPVRPVEPPADGDPGSVPAVRTDDAGRP